MIQSIDFELKEVEYIQIIGILTVHSIVASPIKLIKKA